MTTSYTPSSEFLIPALLVIAAMHYQDVNTAREPVSKTVVYTKSAMAPVPLPDRYSDVAALSQEAQAKILERFVSKLLENSKDPPQEIVDLLNKHFWELT
jgi:hypothetical protein